MADACDSERQKGEVGCTTPHPCNSNCEMCMCVSCLLGCVPVRREEGGRGEGRGRPGCLFFLCAPEFHHHPTRATADKRQKLQGVGMH